MRLSCCSGVHRSNKLGTSSLKSTLFQLEQRCRESCSATEELEVFAGLAARFGALSVIVEEVSVALISLCRNVGWNVAVSDDTSHPSLAVLGPVRQSSDL